MHTHKRMRMHARTHAHTHACSHARTHAPAHRCTCTCTCTHPHMHAHTQFTKLIGALLKWDEPTAERIFKEMDTNRDGLVSSNFERHHGKSSSPRSTTSSSPQSPATNDKPVAESAAVLALAFIDAFTCAGVKVPDPQSRITSPKTTGPLWVALPVPNVPLSKSGPRAWQTQKSKYTPCRGSMHVLVLFCCRVEYENHNILHEPALYDQYFHIDYVATPTMQKRYKNLTNEDRHHAIMSCALAFSHFMRKVLPQGHWWLDSGTLIGQVRPLHHVHISWG